MKINKLEARLIEPKLKKAFPIGEVNGHERIVGPERAMVILQATLANGILAWASIDTLPFPFYNQEWTKGAWELLKEVGGNVVGKEISSPEEIVDILGPIVGHNMFKAGFANLFLDAQALLENTPLYKLVGGEDQAVEVGISIAKSASQEDIQKFISEGFRRIKVKVGPFQDDYEKVRTIREQNPDVLLMVDANSSFDIDNTEHFELLKKFGELDLLMIEQPLAHDDVARHVELQKYFDLHQIPGKVCLDESIESWEQLIEAIEGGIPIINFKIARVGGLHIAKQMIEYCAEKGVDTWIGGMLESTPSKAQSLALATHPGVTLPSDISGTDAYFTEGDDPTVEPMKRNGAYIKVPDIAGRGWQVDQDKLDLVTKEVIVFDSEKSDKSNFDFIPESEAKTYINETKLVVERLAKSIGVSPVDIFIPEYGFLAEPLTLKQKNDLNDDLGQVYAHESVKFQDEVQNIEIEECGEKMVSLQDVFAEEGLTVFFSDKPYHEACGEWAGKSRVYWVREQVSRKLVMAIKALNEIGLTFTIQDAFRPVGVQEGLFKRRITDFILPEHPDWSWEKILLEARSKTGINPRLSGHKSGASIDATLTTLEGEELPMGNKYPEGGAMVALNFPYLTKNEWQTRQLFSAVMRMVGLVPYPGEDWHASYGDNLAGKSTKTDNPSIYGPIKGFNESNGEIIPYDFDEYDKPFFSEQELRIIANLD
jgi:O-succinylbenzoate synthase